MSADVTKTLKKIEADKVKFIRLQFTDVLGMPKNAAIPVAQAEKALTDGTWFDGSSIEGFTRIEESDMLLKADPASYALLPWRTAEGDSVARFVCDVYTYGNKPFEGDPRYVLKKTMAEAAKMGFVFNTGPELEFFLFNLVNGKPTTEFPDLGGYFDLAPNDAGENVRREIVQSLTQMGFEIEMSHHEVAPSQHEINFKYTDAVTTADRVITQKYATRAIALRHGLHASFMAKPIAGINGSGMHTHCSLSKGGKNAFFDADSEKGLSQTALYFIGGLLKHAKAITRLANPTINSYKRLVPGYEAPCYISWSTTNRSALIRVPAARGNGTRTEFRSPDPMCNPYLTFACMLASGLDGIKNKITPPPSTDVNIYHLDQKTRKKLHIDMLPGSLMESHQALLKDEILCNALGSHMVETLDRIATAETDAFRLAVHPWELDRYLATY
ncbi:MULTISPECIES: type I glutamate--ammonia ligase [unclassified Methanoregula]|uniref:type I glutamate--ammonia ligase n=1 Tax=unclassified Methanoregula TaxID=2649730 RepID=UPI0025E01D57|nr:MULTISPECIES: type I glutamate--ammonia ligase [unclassified Methanoregula]